MSILSLTNSYNFFGPKVLIENLSCPIAQEVSKDHRILSCSEGIGRIQVIDQMAQQIIESKVRPEWLNRNGSIKLETLREKITMSDAVAKKLLTDKNYVSLDGLHIYDRESLELTAQYYRGEGKRIQCAFCAQPVHQAIFSPAVALLMHMGRDFNPKRSPDLYKETHEIDTIKAHDNNLSLIEKKETLDRIERVWSSFWVNTLTITLLAVGVIGTLHYLGYLPSHDVIIDKTISIFPM